MSEKVENILIFLGIMALIYLVISFITLQFNPLMWQQDVRVFYIIFAPIGSLWGLCAFRVMQ